MRVQVLGTGCARCKQLTANVEAALRQLDLDATVEKVEDIREIARFGVLGTPALAVDGRIKVAGKVPSASELCGLLGP
jgi:small redox-active disulfide protein 2